jgi:MoaA/NifB/PqqE/SkfB family radical SAM enzyme
MNNISSCSLRKFQHDERCRFRNITCEGIRVVIRLTYRCDLACPHCLVGNVPSSAECNIHTWKKILTELPLIKAKKVLLTGGEPLLHQDVLKITEWIANMNISIDLNSNLQKMTKSMIYDFKKAGLSEISVSIEGPQKLHDKLHGKDGAYYQLLKAIDWANNAGIKIDAACCLTKANSHYIFQLLSDIERLPIQSFTISRLMPIGHGFKNQQESLKQYELNHIYHELTTNWLQQIKIPVRIVGLLGFPCDKDCQRGYSIIGITPDGKVIDCVLSREHPNQIPHPKDVGLFETVKKLRHSLSKNNFAMCF